jgi:hypothetical protein
LKKSGEKGDVVRKVLFMAAVAAAAVFALGAVPVAGAAAGCPNCTPSNSLHVEHNAQLLSATLLSQFNAIVNVNCLGGLGAVVVDAAQQSDQSANGLITAGEGESTVNCDGSWHKLAISVITFGMPWNLGLVDVCAILVTDVTSTAPSRCGVGVTDDEDVMITS